MQHPTALSLLALTALSLVAGPALADGANVFKIGLTRYDTHSQTNGISGIGVPAGADATVNDASTVILVYERLFTPNIGLELVMGIPPTIKAKGTGSVAFLGEVLSAKSVAPTLLLNYHFFDPGATWRPYLGIGVNHTWYTDVRSKLASDVEMGSSTGLAVQAGLTYSIAPDIDAFASIAKVDVKSKVVASGATVLTTTVDFRPLVYSVGVAYRF